jgi:flagellar hook-basal body complex protein FliE
MNSITGISPLNTGLYGNDSNVKAPGENQKTFNALFESAMNLISETNTLTNKAQEEEIKFAMGVSDSIHELQLAQHKANVSLQYTVAVRNNVMDAYRDIMNMTF